MTMRSIGPAGSSVTWVAVVGTRAVRTSLAIWAAVEPDADRLVRVDRDLDLRRRLDEVALEVGQVRVGPPARPRRSSRSMPPRRVVGADDDVQAVRAEAGRLGDLDVVAVALDRCHRRGDRRGLLGEVDGRVEPDGDAWRCSPAPALGCQDRLEAGVALARDARLDELDVLVGTQDLLGLGGLLEDRLRRRARRWSDADLEDLLGAGIDELGRQRPRERERRDEQHGAPRPGRPARSSATAGRC